MVRYTVSWDDPADHLFDVSVSFTAPADGARLLLPAWRPGRYLIQNYAANVRQWRAQTDDGRSLRIWKDGKTSWRVDADAGQKVTVSYRYFAGTLDAGSSFLDHEEAYFNGTNLFMMVEGLRHEPATLAVAIPSDWQIETQLPRSGENEFRARDYDHLVDSPTIAAETMTCHTFEESGAVIHLIFRGDSGIDTEQYADPLQAIVRAQAAMFGGLPLTEYRFLCHAADLWHGVEHEDSCSIIARRQALRGAREGDDAWEKFLSICSHEFFHVWNVKRIVPAAFTPYDYWNETPTRLLWVMEGLTSYFGSLAMLRAGVIDRERYLRHLAAEIETLESASARKHLPLAQASFDGWLHDRMTDPANSFISFYNKGEVVGAMLDLTILRATDGTRGLDDVMRLLWEEYGRNGRGLEEDGFERAVARVADVGDFFERYVDGLDPLPYDDLLGAAGVELISESRSGAGVALGAALSTAEGKLVVGSVVSGGSAQRAGLMRGDEIIAIDGLRTTTEADVSAGFRSLRDGDGVDLLVSRGGVVRSLPLLAEPDPRVTVALRLRGETPTGIRWLRSGR